MPTFPKANQPSSTEDAEPKYGDYQTLPVKTPVLVGNMRRQ